MHRRETPKDRKPIDTDAMGYDAREHEHGQHAVPNPLMRGYHTRPMGVNGRTVDFTERRLRDEDERAIRKAALDRANRPGWRVALDDALLIVGLALAGTALVLLVVGVLNA